MGAAQEQCSPDDGPLNGTSATQRVTRALEIPGRRHVHQLAAFEDHVDEGDAGPVVGRQPPAVLLQDAGLSGSRLHEPEQNAEQRRLAGAVGVDDGVDATVRLRKASRPCRFDTG